MKAIFTGILLTFSILAAGRDIATESTIVKSPDPAGIFCFTPDICIGNGGRLIASFDFGGPGTAALDGPRSRMGDYESGNQARVMLSDDGGASWRDTGARLPMMHSILFKDGKRLYLLGQSGPLVISCSDDNGETWSRPSVLCAEPRWHQSASAIDVRNGKITLVYEKFVDQSNWPGVGLVLMQARCGSDLTKAESWKFSPLFDNGKCALETNTVRIFDRRHPLYDKSGKTWVLLSRCGDGSIGRAVMTRGRELADGSLLIDEFPERSILDFPGGNMKFRILYDRKSRLYWLIHAVAVAGEHERRTLGLSYSRDLFEWKLAGIVAKGASDTQSRHYASMTADGDDLLIVSRSGDSDAANAHDTDIITFHKVSGFRKLAR